MSPNTCLKILVASLLASGAVGAQALTMTLTNWTYGSRTVNVTVDSPSIHYSGGGGGGYSGWLTGAGAHDTSSLLTYCTEIDQHFSFGTSYSDDYYIVTAASYLGNDKALELARMFSWIAANPTEVNDAVESTGLQLAVWNIVYDDDLIVTSGHFHVNDSTASDTHANMLLGHAGDSQQALTQDMYLLHSGPPGNHQDQLFWEPAPPVISTLAAVPEPTSLALGALALTGLAAVRRRQG